MARYLVTGGAGFIGSNLVEALLGRGQQVRVLDDFSTGRRSNLEPAESWKAPGAELELIEGDFCDRGTCARALDGVDFVLHQAAIPSVPRSVADPLGTNAVNVSGTLGLLESAKEAGVRRFVFASSSSLYGESETLPKVETMASAPISPYGLQKLAGETYCKLYTRLYGLLTVALRYFNVFGPRQDPSSDYAAVIPKFITTLRDGEPATVFGDGEQTRDFNYVANAVSANLLACEAPLAACGRAYNVACGDRISLNRLVEILGELLGVTPRAVHAEPRNGDIRHSLADVGAARDALGYRPEVDLLEGLRRTVASY